MNFDVSLQQQEIETSHDVHASSPWRLQTSAIRNRTELICQKVLIWLLEVCQELNKCGNCPVRWDLRDEVNYTIMKGKASVSLIVSLHIIICSILEPPTPNHFIPNLQGKENQSDSAQSLTWTLAPRIISITTVTFGYFWSPSVKLGSEKKKKKTRIDFLLRKELQVWDTLYYTHIKWRKWLQNINAFFCPRRKSVWEEICPSSGSGRGAEGSSLGH